MRISSLLVLSVLLSSPVLSCELPQGEKIFIGCTYKCDFVYRFRLMMTGFRLGYRIKFIDLKEMGAFSNSLKNVDAVLIPGGADIDPAYYLSNVTDELKNYTIQNRHLVKFSSEGRSRDPFEYGFVKHYLSDNSLEKLPLLGICRGMQMMSVAKGIPLYLDIKTELGISNRINKFDRIHITESSSLMSELYGERRFRAFEFHHQGIRVDYFEKHKNDYPHTLVSAYSNNGMVAEAIEYTDRMALGVQFHPEKSFSGATYPVFKWFLTKACEYKNSIKDN